MDAIGGAMRKTLCSLAFLLFAHALEAAPPSAHCTLDTCKAGTVALTYFKKSDPYFRCPNRELTDYTTTIVGLTALQSALGVTPNVSEKTGEPEYEGQTKVIVDTLRARAGVRSFDQAVAMCALGANGRRVTVINAPAEPFYNPVVFVFDESLKATY